MRIFTLLLAIVTLPATPQISDASTFFSAAPSPIARVSASPKLTGTALMTDTVRYVTAPTTLPPITITVPASQTAEGKIFMSTFASPGPSNYLMIIDEAGNLVYYKEQNRDISLMDFKRQPSGSLTYYESIPGNQAFGSYKEMNPSYEVTATWQSGAPELADNHDIQLLPNGNALLLVYHHESRDLSAYGGLTNTEFIDTWIQEVDLAGNVYFDWHLSDHIPVTNSYESPSISPFDHSHGNAIEVDTDGNLLLSSRHLSEITKINRQTGQIIWRLGGKGNQFNFVNDGGFSYQHDIRRQTNGHLTLFDNGNQRVPLYSRAVEYEIDEINKVVTRTWEYRHTPDIFGGFMGNVQVLPNNNRLVGWGGPNSIATEVGADGTPRMEVVTSAGYVYRWYRFPWQGFPTITPTLVLSDGVTGAPTLYYSWNGATEIASYRVESGRINGFFTATMTQTKTGFETSTPLTAMPADACFYRVMPIDKNGQDTLDSNVVFRGGSQCESAIGITLVPTTQLALLGQVISASTRLVNTGVTPLTQISVTSSVADCNTTLTHLQAISDTISTACNIGPITTDLTVTSFVSASAMLISTTPEISPAVTFVTATSVAFVKVITPSLALTVTPTEQGVRRGTTAGFTITVKNTGNAAFSQVSIDFPQVGTCSRTLTGTLQVDEQVSYACAEPNVFIDFTGLLTATGQISTGQISNPIVTFTDIAQVRVVVYQRFLPIVIQGVGT